MQKALSKNGRSVNLPFLFILFLLGEQKILTRIITGLMLLTQNYKFNKFLVNQ